MKLKPYSRVCDNGKLMIIFDKEIWKPKENVFEKLDMFGINISTEQRHSPQFIMYDFETWLKVVDSSDTKMKFVDKDIHELLSINLIGNE